MVSNNARAYLVITIALFTISALLLIPLSFGTGEKNDTKAPDGFNSTSSVEQPQLSTERYIIEYPRGSSSHWMLEEDVSMKNPNHSAYEVTRYPNANLTEKNLNVAWVLYNMSYESAKEHKLFDFRNATDAGYQEYSRTHYLNKEYYFDKKVLDPHKPEVLIYLNFKGKKVLVGYVYLTDGLETEGKQIAGPLTTWHYHPTPQNKRRCFSSWLDVGVSFNQNECSENSVKKYRSPEMIHLWFVRHPKGPFSMGATGLLESSNISNGVPEKMSEDEFKRYAENTYEENYAPD